MRPSRLGTEGCDTTNSGIDGPRCSILNCGQRSVLDQFTGAAHAAPTKWLPAFTVELELEADLCATFNLRSTDDLRRAPTRQPHLRPADLAAEVLSHRSAQGLHEPLVACMERVHILDVVAA